MFLYGFDHLSNRQVNASLIKENEYNNSIIKYEYLRSVVVLIQCRTNMNMHNMQTHYAI